MIPRDYKEWRHCIVVKCGIELTEAFVKARLATLRDPSAEETKKFGQRYGEPYLGQVVKWFERASKDLGSV